MYFCYLDESGAPQASAQTSHFVLLGVAIPALDWHAMDFRVGKIKREFNVEDAEIHTGYLARTYAAQAKIPDFEKLQHKDRRKLMHEARKESLSKAKATGNSRKYRLEKKLHAKTDAYIHLTHQERMNLLRTLADEIGNCGRIRLFADAIDKLALPTGRDAFEIAFEQIVSRFQRFLENQEQLSKRHRRGTEASLPDNHGLLIQDNNQTVAKNITSLMRRFHRTGTLWATCDRIIETPLFVDSTLTSMVQIADLCAYATRRFFENQEVDLFDRIYPRFERRGPSLVGLRHYVGARKCECKVCVDHKKKLKNSTGGK